jgi:hypothetical protein
MDRQAKNDMMKFIFPNVNFNIGIEIDDLSNILSYRNYIIIVCEDSFQKETILLKNKGYAITIEHAIGALEDNEYFHISEKTFLTSFKKINEYKFEAVFDY